MRKDEGLFLCLIGMERVWRVVVMETALWDASTSPSWADIQRPLIVSLGRSHSYKLNITSFPVTLSHSNAGL